jgi:hypothetical protein
MGDFLADRRVAVVKRRAETISAFSLPSIP